MNGNPCNPSTEAQIRPSRWVALPGPHGIGGAEHWVLALAAKGLNRYFAARVAHAIATLKAGGIWNVEVQSETIVRISAPWTYGVDLREDIRKAMIESNRHGGYVGDIIPMGPDTYEWEGR